MDFEKASEKLEETASQLMQDNEWTVSLIVGWGKDGTISFNPSFPSSGVSENSSDFFMKVAELCENFADTLNKVGR
jgi:hypothetical protein